MTAEALIKIRNRLLDALYPSRVVCACCNREASVDETLVCAQCANKLTLYDEAETISKYIDGYGAAFMYNEAVRRAVHRFKFQNRPDLGTFFASYMRINADWEVDYIVPVPLHPLRLLNRGYNQSEILAREIARREGLTIGKHILKRLRYTKSQTKNTVNERRTNISGAFGAKNAEGLCVLLIDDVCTTGGTLDECAHVLKAAGAAKVFALTACRTTSV